MPKIFISSTSSCRRFEAVFILSSKSSWLRLRSTTCTNTTSLICSRSMRITSSADKDFSEKSVGTRMRCSRFFCSSSSPASSTGFETNSGLSVARAKSKVVLPKSALLKKPFPCDATIISPASSSSAISVNCSKTSPLR